MCKYFLFFIATIIVNKGDLSHGVQDSFAVAAHLTECRPAADWSFPCSTTDVVIGHHFIARHGVVLALAACNSLTVGYIVV